MRQMCTLAAVAALGLFIGCGGGSTTPSAVAVTAGTPANLNGNWILTPVSSGTSGTPSINGVVMTVTVSGASITGFATLPVVCGSTTSLTTATLAGAFSPSGGTFSLSGGGMLVLSVQGNTPTVAGGAWTGSYTYVASPGTCSVSGSSSIGATAMPALSGAYTSSGDLLQSNVLTPVTMTLTLQQEALKSSSYPESGQAVSGSITIQGSSCLTSGTIQAASLSTTPAGSLGGTDLELYFSMNDGSQLLLTGTVSATDASQFVGTMRTYLYGACNSSTTFVPSMYPTVVSDTFLKQ
jgi:hypothetical protein